MADNWISDMITALDKNQPRWFIEWANQQDLADRLTDPRFDDARLKGRVAMRLFHPIITAAISPRIVK